METKSVAKGLLFGGIASCLAEAATMPVDVIKVRLQVSGSDGKKVYSGLVDAFASTVRKEGAGALFKGLPPALIRQASYGSLRYGLYAPIRNLIGVGDKGGKDQIPLHIKILSGGSSGALASFIANPTDLLKVRMQVDGMHPGQPRKYRGVAHAFRSIVQSEGVLGLWRGSGPTIGRATVLTAVELSSYDEVKSTLLRAGLIAPGTLGGVFLTSLCSGFFGAVASSPFDVVKSRVMGQPVDAAGRGTLYSGMLDCFVKSVKSEGLLCLWKGFLPNWARIGPRGVICFVTMETLNKWWP